jgi:hypothetical protein
LILIDDNNSTNSYDSSKAVVAPYLPSICRRVSCAQFGNSQTQQPVPSQLFFNTTFLINKIFFSKDNSRYCHIRTSRRLLAFTPVRRLPRLLSNSELREVPLLYNLCYVQLNHIYFYFFSRNSISLLRPQLFDFATNTCREDEVIADYLNRTSQSLLVSPLRCFRHELGNNISRNPSLQGEEPFSLGRFSWPWYEWYPENASLANTF